MELKDIFVFYDSDRTPDNFDDWFWGIFRVDNVATAYKLFQKWLNEYLDNEDLWYNNDRYQYIIEKAKAYGYVYLTDYDYYGGFGC